MFSQNQLSKLLITSEFSRDFKSDNLFHQSEANSMSIGAQTDENGVDNKEVEKAPSSDHSSLVNMDDDDQSSDESDEFFDFSDSEFDDRSEETSNLDVSGPEIYSQDIIHVKAYAPPDNVLSKMKHEYTVNNKGCEELGKIVWEEGHEITLAKDQTGNLVNTWSVPEPSIFQIRGETFLKDRKKIKAQSAVMETVAVDWLRSNKREDDIARRPRSIVQKFAADGRPEFFVVVNFQIPGSTTYNLAFYYMISTPIKDAPLLERFIEGDDAFRNSRFKLIPNVSKGPWLLRQSVGRGCVVGHLLKLNYFRGTNYLEIDVDIGSSKLAKGVTSSVFSCFKNLIVEIAFIIQANTAEELPEHVYGVCRLNHLDISKSSWANP